MRMQPLYACAVSRDLCVGANFSHIFEILDPDLPIRYATFMALRLRQMELLAKPVYDLVLKITQRSAHAQNHVSVQRCRKSFTTIVLGDNDFPLTGSNFGNLMAFRAIFMVALCNRADHYIFVLWFVVLLLSFFPRLISAAVDWMSTILPYMVWP